MIRYLAEIDAQGVVKSVVRHVGPSTEADHGLHEISEAEYQAVASGRRVIRTETGFEISERTASYAELRGASYPSFADQLDALWKGGDALADMQQKILAVKAAYPKPKEV